MPKTGSIIGAMRISELLPHGVPAPLAKVWVDLATELTEIQERAVAAGAFDGETNLLVVAPTSSGKTLVGEFAATSAAYKTRRHAIFLVPYRALADEHYANFSERYGEFLSVVVSTSDWTEFDDDIRSGNFGVAVMTYEKLVGLLVEHPQLLTRCSVIVVDEVQMLGDRSRGAGLEMLLTQVLLAENGPQLIALSASLDSLNKLDAWLEATLVIANERPVPLTESVLAPMSGRLLGTDDEVDHVIGQSVDDEEAIAEVVRKFVVDDDKQVLVFRSSIDKTRQTAERLKRYLPAPGLLQATAALLDELPSSENVELLRRTLASRVGFHNGDLTHEERRAVEQSFRVGDSRVLVATTTLAMGVNLPTDVVLVGDYKRFFFDRGNWNFEEISVAEYKNAAGRAGRLGQRTSGQAILVAERDVEQRQLLDFYCRGDVESVESQLTTQRFDDVVFNVLANGLADTAEGLVDFIAATFAYLTFYETSGGLKGIRDGVDRAVAACRDTGFIREEDGKLTPTRTALIFARHGIPLVEAAHLSALAQRLVEGPVAKPELIFEISCCDKLFERRPYVWDKARRAPQDLRADLDISADDLAPGSAFRLLLEKGSLGEDEARIIARTSCLLEWGAGVDEAQLARRYKGCPPSRQRGMGKNAAWLLDAVEQVADLRGAGADEVEAVRAAARETRYGVPVALAQLARLNARGVGRAALLRLYAGDNGRRLYEPDVLLDAELNAFDGLLTATEVDRLRNAIVADRGETLRRRRRSHVERAEQTAFDAQLVEELYTAEGGALEQAVADALESVGVNATRIVRQGKAEEDLQISCEAGTLVVSVTASKDEAKRVSWNKAREVLGTGAGLNPVNYLCVARPGFHSLAERKADEIAREEGSRRLLLVPIDLLAEAIVRVGEGRLDGKLLTGLLANTRGLLKFGDLPASAESTINLPV